MNGTIPAMRRIAVFVATLVLSVSLHAEEVFFSNIINASFLSDFAMSAFPVSFWGEFGIDHLDFMPDLNTKAVVRVEAGMAQRTLKQWMTDTDSHASGSIIMDPADQRDYTVVFSDGRVGFSQGLVDNPREGAPDFITLNAFVGMRWEQAFASLADIQASRWSGFFEDPEYYPVGDNSEVAGVPELAGKKYSLTTSIMLGITLDNIINHYLTPEGYSFSFDLTFAPWWLLNQASIFGTSVTTDYYKILANADYKHTFYQQIQEDSAMNLFSVYMDFSLTCQMIFGDTVPQHALSVTVRGDSIPPRPFITNIHAGLTVTGPEFITVGTYPSITVFLENALSAGKLLNSPLSEPEVRFYGTIGARFNLYIMGLFRAYIGVYYDYLNPEGSVGGFDYEIGGYFTASF